tara:strand:- start:4970 stop:5713 length:744 start_codon:yes stop_codon:yes gene_type:complete
MQARKAATSVALVLAGGLGTRLRGAVADRPKALAEIAGRPFLAWQLDELAKNGITQVILCTHYMSDMIETAFPADTVLPNGIQITYSRETTPLDTGGALRLAVEQVPPDESVVLAVNGDTFCNFDLAAMFGAHNFSRANATLLLSEVDDVLRYGSVDARKDGYVTAFNEKSDVDGGAGWISAGVYLLCLEALRTLPLGRKVSLERDVFPNWIGKGLYAFSGGSHFLDIGTPVSFAQAETYLQKAGLQ